MVRAMLSKSRAPSENQTYDSRKVFYTSNKVTFAQYSAPPTFGLHFKAIGVQSLVSFELQQSLWACCSHQLQSRHCGNLFQLQEGQTDSWWHVNAETHVHDGCNQIMLLDQQADSWQHCEFLVFLFPFLRASPFFLVFFRRLRQFL